MPRRLLPLLVLLAGCVVDGAEPSEAAAGGAPVPPADPVVVVVTLDAFRADYLSPEVMPFLSGAMHAQGLTFDRHWNSSNWTWPTMTTVATGHHLRNWGIAPVMDTMSGGIPEDTPPIARLFADAGHATWCNSANAIVGTLTGLTDGCAVMDKSIPGTVPIAHTQLVDGALPWITTTATPGQPVFAWVHTMDTHDAYDGALSERCRADAEAALALCPSDLQEDAFWEDAARWTDAEQRACDAGIRAVQRCLAAGIDDALGAFSAGLDDAGLGDRLVWLVTADHGENDGRVHDGVPRYLHAQTLNAPETSGFAWLSWPGAPAQDVGRATTGATLLPSLLELLDLPVPAEIEVASVWQDAPGPISQLACQDGAEVHGVVSEDGSRHLVYDGAYALYAPLTDPGETLPLDPADAPGLTDLIEQNTVAFAGLCR